MQTYEISLDMRKAPGRIERTVTVRRGDNGTQTVSAAITAGGRPYSPGGTARLDILHADGTWARCSASVSGSTVSCTLPGEALNGAGRCRAAHFVFTDGAKVESTEGFALVIEGNVDANGTPGAQGYEDELEAMKAAWREFAAAAERDEAARVQAETARAEAERGRSTAENARAQAELSRADAETARVAAEAARAEAESGRVTAEDARKAAETSRVQAETARAEAERGRSTAETARAEAETARAAAQAKNDADQALNNEQMKRLSPVILTEGQYDRATLQPTIEGEPNRMYFVPMVAPAAYELFGLSKAEVQAGNAYVEWMWIESRWEQMGQSEIRNRPISTDQIDAVYAGSHPTGEDVLNLTGLDYVRTKDAALLDGKANASHTHPKSQVDGLQSALDGKANASHTHPKSQVDGLQSALDGKANASHTHAAGDITSGTLPIARGGTGGATAEAARAALGASSQADTDALRESLSQVFQTEGTGIIGDLNDAPFGLGAYAVSYDSQNTPSGYGVVLTLGNNGTSGSTYWIFQLAFGTSGTVYHRSCINSPGAWGAWKAFS